MTGAKKKTVSLAGLCSGLGLVLILLVVLLCLPLALPRLLGYQPYAIVSGSMEPAIPTGSLVYARAAEPNEVETGDVIVFQGSGGIPVTHRVVENQTEEGRFITKGDANDVLDLLPVSYTALLGRVAFSVPLLGRLLPGFSTQQGKFYLVGLLLAGVIFRIVGGRLRAQEDEA